MTTVKISEFLSANVKGSKIISQTIVQEKIIPNTSHEIIFFVTISASSGEVIRSKPNIFLNAIVFNSKTFGIQNKQIESNQPEDRIFSLIVENLDGVNQAFAGDLNSFNTYPILSISGFLNFSIPLSLNEQLGSPLLKIRNS